MKSAGPYFAMFFPLIVLAVLLPIIMGLISVVGGWRRLAERFRTQEPFYGEYWGWQSAQLRGWCNYNHCLKVGANPEALYLAVNFPFGMFHPPLLIPWREIEVETGKVCFGWYDVAAMRIGTEERIRVRIYGKLVQRVREAAGPGWPLYRIEEMDRLNG
jgi:hypothetical protein